MDHLAIIIVLYMAGILLLIAEVFVPSGGLLTVGALVCLGAAVFQTFGRNTTAGMIGATASLMLIPTIFFLGIKYVRHLPMGDRLAPPNPSLTDKDQAFDTSETERFVGVHGSVVTPLRPVGICEFDGRRVQCVAESGMIDKGAAVAGVGMKLNNLMVRAVATETATQTSQA